MSDGRIEVIQERNKLASESLEIAHLEDGEWEVDGNIADRLLAFLKRHGTSVRVSFILDGEEK